MRLWLVPIAMACSEVPCPSYAELPVGGDRERADTIRTAMQDFAAWSGHAPCVRDVEIGDRRQWWEDGFSIRPEDETPARTVFHRMCSLVDLAEPLAASAPEIFNGVGLDETEWVTHEARIREDFARTCERWKDPTEAWLLPAVEPCGVPPSPEAAFIAEFFEDFPHAMPPSPVRDVVLGGVEGMTESARLAAVGDVLYATESRWVEDHHERHILAVDIPDLTQRWFVSLPTGEDTHLHAGITSALWMQDGVVRVLTPDGYEEAASVSDVVVKSCAEDAEGWWCNSADNVLFRYDPVSGLSDTTTHSGGTLHSDPEHHWSNRHDHVVQHTTGETIGIRGQSWFRAKVGEEWIGYTLVRGESVRLRREADGRWYNEAALCDDAAFYLSTVPGVHRRLVYVRGGGFGAAALNIHELVSD